MDQSDLESLLSSLRKAQDDPAPPPPPPAAAAAASPPVAPLTQPTASSAPSVPVPSQSDLEALLSTLRALPESQATGPARDDRSDPTPLPTRGRDLSKHSFQEALPIVNALAIDQAFLDKIEGVWEEQKNWELRMKDERNRLVLQLKRSGSSPVAQAQRLREWDRALQTRWTKLQAEQQERLQAMGVPTFQKTTDPTLLRRQERLVDVLVGFLEDRES
ncbi:hypothetical protein JCM8202_002094 [Rhodotorula sphaerocarpa]